MNTAPTTTKENAMNAPLNENQAKLLADIIEVSDRSPSGTCPSIYSRFGNTLRALERRGLITYQTILLGDPFDYVSNHRVCYEAAPTDAGRAAVAS